MGETAAIFLSRQALRPDGRAAWVRKSVAAVEWLKRNDCTLLASCGMQTWELVLACASLTAAPRVVFLPASSPGEYRKQREMLIRQFALEESLTRFEPLIRPDCDHAEMAHLRDEAIVGAANLLLPISLRSGGNMRHLLQGCDDRIVGTFRTEYEGRDSPLAYKWGADQLNPDIAEAGEEYLIHWTRGSNSAWPDETLIDYYRAVINSDTYPRTAFATLTHIVEGGRIIASSGHMPANTPTISLSGLSPHEVIPLMKWRARYRHMSFEPYGIGIRKEYALAVGIRAVQYYDRSAPRPAGLPVWLTQSKGEITDWRAEREYRHHGDIDLRAIPRAQLLAITLTAVEADELQKKTGLRAVSFLP